MALLAIALGVCPAAAQDLAHGKTLFEAQCVRCHGSKKDANVYGPDLRGVAGRKAARVKAFDYSPALRKSAIVWDWASLNAFLAQPRVIVPRTSMPGISAVIDPDDRRDLIAYLQSLR